MVKIEVAEPKDRFVAAAIDFLPPFLLFLFFAVIGADGLATVTAVFGGIYLLARDLVGNGQSLGKRFRNLQVVDADTDRVPDTAALLLRNLGFLVPGLNAIYAIVEGVQVVRHPQGLRFGDVFAQTGVVKVPKEDREKLLIRPVERKAREVPPKAEATETHEGTPVENTVVSPIPDGDEATVLSPPAPAKAPAGKPARAALDLPDYPAPQAARPASAPAAGGSAPKAPAAAGGPGARPASEGSGARPAPGSQGVTIGDDDPLKKLIEKAGGAKPT